MGVLESVEPWQRAILERYSGKTYVELAAAPEETPIEGPGGECVRHYIRRVMLSEEAGVTPLGTVEISVCSEVFEGGKFKRGSRITIEMTPQGEVLDPMRAWDPED